MISKQSLKKAWEKTKKGYGKGVAFTQKYAPIAEQRFGRMANVAVGAFQPVKMEVQPDFRVPRRDAFVQLPLKRPIKPRRQHDFGSLSFDI